MQAKFRSTFNKVRLLFSKKNPKLSGKHKKKALSVNEMKMLLFDIFPNLQSELSHKKTINDVLDVVKRKCSIVDVHPLEVLAVHFKIKEAENIIIKHKEAAKVFCRSVFVSLSNDKTFQAIPTRYLLSEIITLVLNRNPDKTTLQDINDILLELQLLHKYCIKVVEIKPGQSVVVTCYCPAEYTGLLIMAVLNKIVILQEKGLKKFILGKHSTVWDAQVVDLVNENKDLLVQINNLKAALEERDKRITATEINLVTFQEISENRFKKIEAIQMKLEESQWINVEEISKIIKDESSDSDTSST
ncbi:PREDICTED: uncharacterized protein LOC109589427 [Amphimedon queenslandica]|uniref:Uncharacterized protein n=1 Tax=Amphimedon queenslandica TaxID=400682 RepID=A0AAN0JVH7_AMPQE|nr:PREDICTED: uncharacterized protein LOC109589427 [Amphimedon queenslandica]|eukprot:XP_019861077.1 PREDICTED: uncharacterized protein LOC109589427 [Amphimedon queenslandica]